MSCPIYAEQAVAEETNPYDTDNSDDEFEFLIAKPFGHALANTGASPQRRKRGYGSVWTFAPWGLRIFCLMIACINF